MVRFGNVPKKETFTDLYNDYVNEFLTKIRKSIETDVCKELRHLGKFECDMDLFTLYEMAAKIEDELYVGTLLQRTIQNIGKNKSLEQLQLLSVIIVIEMVMTLSNAGTKGKRKSHVHSTLTTLKKSQKGNGFLGLIGRLVTNLRIYCYKW